MQRLSSVLRRMNGLKLLFGDWNFVAGGESRERASDEGAAQDEASASHFDECFDQFGGLHQHEFTWRRLPRHPGGAPVYSRLDRIGRRRGLDRGPGQRSRRSRCVPTSPFAQIGTARRVGCCVAAGFAGKVREELRGMRCPRNLDTRMAILAGIAFRARGFVHGTALPRRPLDDAARATHCLKVLSKLRANSEDQAAHCAVC